MAALWPRPLDKSIMKKLITQCMSLVVLLFIAQVSNAQQLPLTSKASSSEAISSEGTSAKSISEQAFNQQVFQQVKEKYQGTKWLMLLWSVDCPPCMKELALVQALRQTKNDLAVVMINVDSDEGSAQQRQEILQQFNLAGLNHFYFRDGFEDHSRYLIDPQWFGELPRSYFVDEAGTLHGKSGLVAKALLEKWLLADNN